MPAVLLRGPDRQPASRAAILSMRRALVAGLALLLGLLAIAPAGAQLAPNGWLVEVPGAGPGLVHEVDPQGQLVASWPGPLAGTRGVAKEPNTGAIYVIDEVRQAVLVYRTGQGLVTTVAAPNARGLAVSTSGVVALLQVPGIFQPGQVQMVEFGPNGNPPPPIPVGYDPVRILAGRSGVLWVVNRVSGTVTRIANRQAQHLTVGGGGRVLEDAAVDAEGRLYVLALGTPEVFVFEEDGRDAGSLSLPEVPQSLAIDGDRTLWTVSSTLWTRRYDLRTRRVISGFALPFGSYGDPHPDARGGFWIEEVGQGRLQRFDGAGNLIVDQPLPSPTLTRGDVFGLDYALKAAPFLDADGDGFASGEERDGGSNPLDPASTPPSLEILPRGGYRMDLVVSHPTAPLRDIVIAISLDGTGSLELGSAGGPPYLRLTPDFLTEALLFADPVVQPYITNLPFAQLDGSGRHLATIDFCSLPQAMNAPLLHAAVVVAGPMGWTSVSGTSVTRTFDVTGQSW